MALKKITVSLILAVFMGIAMSFFSKREVSLTISYTLNYEGDSWQKNRTGLLWALSYLGADLPKGSFDKNIEWVNKRSFRIHFHELGFNDQALQALKVIADSIEQTPQYKKMKSLDLGQFIALTVGSSWHYYAITGVPSHYTDFLKAHQFRETHRFPLLHSTVANHHRLITGSSDGSILHAVFIAEEGECDLTDSLFKTMFYEVMDIMPNGQLRFAVYDASGQLADASPRLLGRAGKPAKCIWCHEIKIQPLFAATDSIYGRMGPHEFQQLVISHNQALDAYRESLQSDIDFSRKQDHTLMELAYISYMEPSVKKLAQEWHLPRWKIRRLLKKELTHTHEEFGFLTGLYNRADVTPYAPCQWLCGPADIREPSNKEPDFVTKLRKP